MASKIPLPDDVAASAGLYPIDYDEAFCTESDGDLSPEAWARLCLEDAPSWMRAVMITGWQSLGIQLAPFDSDGAVLGWPVLRSDSEVIVLGVEASVGLTARIVIRPSPTRVVHSMVVRYETTAGRAAWTAIAPLHRAFVRRLLDVASRPATVLDEQHEEVPPRNAGT